jgi:hypothetical protein
MVDGPNVSHAPPICVVEGAGDAVPGLPDVAGREPEGVEQEPHAVSEALEFGGQRSAGQALPEQADRVNYLAMRQLRDRPQLVWVNPELHVEANRSTS